MITSKDFQAANERHKDMQRFVEREQKARELVGAQKPEKQQSQQAGLRNVLGLFL